MVDLQGLPAVERVEEGLRDLRDGQWSKAALWLAMASRRLRFLGLPIPAALSPPGEPELSLYEEFQREGGDAYFRYNAWRRELDSFLSALESRQQRTLRQADAG